MLKEARKPSTDPAQEKLRQNKAAWNKEVSAFINDLIHLKKMMNGWPSKFYQQRSRIGEPIPADPATIIGSLAGDFQELAQKGNVIVQEQLNYSKGRRKKQPKAPSLVSPTATTTPAAQTPEPTKPDLATQLSMSAAADKFESKYGLVSEASNPITRFFTRLLTPTRGISEAARIRRFRMDMLKASAKTYKSLSRLQAAIVGSSKDSATQAHKQMQQTWNDWSLVTRGFSVYKSVMPAQITDAGGDLPPPDLDLPEEKPSDLDKFETEPAVSPPPPMPAGSSSETLILAKAAIIDCKKVSSKPSFMEQLPPNFFSTMDPLIGKFTTVPAASRGVWAEAIVKEHRRLVSMLNQKFGVSGGSLSQISDILDAKAKAAIPPGVHMPKTAELEAVAQLFLKKWLGKARHQFIPKDTSSYRLEVYKVAGDARQTVNEIMDHLEKGLDVEALQPMIMQVNKQMTSLRTLVRSIHFAEKPGDAPPLTQMF